MKKILLFAKSPCLGVVKTRLKEKTPLSEKEILALYDAFLRDTLKAALLSQATQVVIAFFPANSEQVMKKALLSYGLAHSLKEGRISLFPQVGNSFENRVSHADSTTRKKGDSLLIIGSDAPTLSPSILNKAFRTIHQKESIVLGPSGEGGVYLIGIHSHKPFSFTGAFNHGLEIVNLVEMAKKRKLSLGILEEVTDVDIHSDLLTLIGNLKGIEHATRSNKKVYLPRATVKTLKQLKITIERSKGGSRDKTLVKRVETVSSPLTKNLNKIQ